jgi:hypothetical protein
VELFYSSRNAEQDVRTGQCGVGCARRDRCHL